MKEKHLKSTQLLALQHAANKSPSGNFMEEHVMTRIKHIAPLAATARYMAEVCSDSSMNPFNIMCIVQQATQNQLPICKLGTSKSHNQTCRPFNPNQDHCATGYPAHLHHPSHQHPDP